MKKQKMSLANMQGKMSRGDMKNINGGVDDGGGGAFCSSSCSGSCIITSGVCIGSNGTCHLNYQTGCFCVAVC